MDEEQNPSCLKSSMKYPQSVMIWGTMSSAGVSNLCFLKSKAHRNILPECFRGLHDCFFWGSVCFIFQQDLAHAKYYTLTYHLKSTIFWLIWYDPNFFLSSVKTFRIYVLMGFFLAGSPTYVKNKQINTWNHLNYGPWIYNLLKFNLTKRNYGNE